jgi:hypothetical protein
VAGTNAASREKVATINAGARKVVAEIGAASRGKGKGVRPVTSLSEAETINELSQIQETLQQLEDAKVDPTTVGVMDPEIQGYVIDEKARTKLETDLQARMHELRTHFRNLGNNSGGVVPSTPPAGVAPAGTSPSAKPPAGARPPAKAPPTKAPAPQGAVYPNSAAVRQAVASGQLKPGTMVQVRHPKGHLVQVPAK